MITNEKAKGHMIEALNEEYQHTCCIPLDDKVSNLLIEKAKVLISNYKEISFDDLFYAFYVENIFLKEDVTNVKISLINPFEKEAVCDGFFVVLWDEIKDSDFTSF